MTSAPRTHETEHRIRVAAPAAAVFDLVRNVTQWPLIFDDVVPVHSGPDQIYAFIHDAEQWAERIPHVARAALAESMPNVQVLEMDTRTQDGSTHTTKSVRVCFAHDRIVYKQLQVP